MSSAWQDEVDSILAEMLDGVSPREAQLLLDYWEVWMPRLQEALRGVAEGE